MAIDFKPIESKSEIDFQPIEKPKPTENIEQNNQNPIIETGKAVAGFASDVFKNVTKPLVQVAAQIPQSVEKIATGKATTYNVPYYGELKFPETKKEILGRGAKALSLGMGPVSGGAAYFGGEALEQNKSVKDIAMSTAGGAAFGAVTKGFGKALSKAPETAWSSVLKRTPTAAVKNPELEKAAAQQGITGFTRKQISSTLGKKIQEIELQVDDILNAKTGNVETWNVVEKLRSLYDAYSKIPGEEDATKSIIGMANQVLEKGKSITAQEANQLKRAIYGVISKTYGKGLLEIPAKKESQKLIARGLKEEIEKVIPEIKGLNEKQAVLIQMKKAIDATIARQEGKGIAGTGVGLFDLLIGGGTAGITINPINGLIAIGAKKTIESSSVLSTTGLGLQKMINVWNKMSPTQKIIFYNGLRGVENNALNPLSGKKE